MSGVCLEAARRVRGEAQVVKKKRCLTGFGKPVDYAIALLGWLERSFHSTGTPVTPKGDEVPSLCATGALSGAPVGQEPMGYLKIFDAVIYVGFFFSVITT